MEINKSINTIISIGKKVLAGQQNAVLNQSSQAIDITNKIDPEWQESLAGTKMWNITCSGVYVMNADSLIALQEAFMTNTTVDVSIDLNGTQYIGSAIITNFPLNTTFSQELKYNLTLLGTGPLEKGK